MDRRAVGQRARRVDRCHRAGLHAAGYASPICASSKG
jgi:hypothetical protein